MGGGWSLPESSKRVTSLRTLYGPYYTILDKTRLDFAILLYCTLLYYTTLLCTILHHTITITYYPRKQGPCAPCLLAWWGPHVHPASWTGSSKHQISTLVRISESLRHHDHLGHGQKNMTAQIAHVGSSKNKTQTQPQ